jgi:hypothetical protein
VNKIVYKFNKRYRWNYQSPEEKMQNLRKDLDVARADIKWLIEILVEANVIEDVPNREPQRTRIVKDYTDTWGFPYEHRQAFKVNSIKSKGTK